MTRSGAVLIATVIGGSATFFGPVIGALVLTVLSVALASVTRAWPVYLGLSFIGTVLWLPQGISGWWGRHRERARRYGGRRLALAYALGAIAAAAWIGALVIGAESLYARRFAADAGGVWRIRSLEFDLGSPATWTALAMLVAIGSGAYSVLRLCLRHTRKAKQP
jgi:branched-chain amino acid transport system permease protein